MITNILQKDASFHIYQFTPFPCAIRGSHPSEVLASLNADERAAWEFLNYRSSATSAELQAHAGFDERKTQRILKKLVDVKLIRRVGKGPSTRYEMAQV